MEELELEYNNYITYIFIFAVRNGEFQYYFSDKVDWLMDNWEYIETEKNRGFIDEALDRVKEDKIDFNTIQKEYIRLKNEGKKDAMINNLPMLFVNFDEKILKSRYYEQDLHFKIIDGWIGSLENFLDEIPIDYKYWKEVLEI